MLLLFKGNKNTSDVRVVSPVLKKQLHEDRASVEGITTSVNIVTLAMFTAYACKLNDNKTPTLCRKFTPTHGAPGSPAYTVAI